MSDIVLVIASTVVVAMFGYNLQDGFRTKEMYLQRVGYFSRTYQAPLFWTAAVINAAFVLIGLGGVIAGLIG